MKRWLCLEEYYSPALFYAKKVTLLALDDNNHVAILAVLALSIIKIFERIIGIDFGIPGGLLATVFCTICLDAYFGIKKSLKQAKEALEMAALFGAGAEHRRYRRMYNLKKFRPKKLQYTFFKMLTLLGYLYFAKSLIAFDSDSHLQELLGMAGGLMLKVPLAIFWYYDFKSIGANTEYLYGKKAPIFKIIENIVEAKIKKI